MTHMTTEPTKGKVAGPAAGDPAERTPHTGGIGFDELPHLMSLMTGDEKHGPAATSTLDALWVLYDRVLRVSPGTADDPDRDRFLLSKGHGPMAYYAVLAAKGFFPAAWLPGFGAYDSPLGHHPDRTLVPGVEIGSGSLGHGLPLAVGTALGLRAQGLTEPAVWVLIGDAETGRGQQPRGAGLRGRRRPGPAAHPGRRQLLRHPRLARRDRLPLRGRRLVGATVDGRDHRALHEAFSAPHPGRPRAVIARVEPKGD